MIEIEQDKRPRSLLYFGCWMSLKGPCVAESFVSRMARAGKTFKAGPDERSLDHWGCAFHGEREIPAFSLFLFLLCSQGVSCQLSPSGLPRYGPWCTGAVDHKLVTPTLQSLNHFLLCTWWPQAFCCRVGKRTIWNDLFKTFTMPSHRICNSRLSFSGWERPPPRSGHSTGQWQGVRRDTWSTWEEVWCHSMR